MHTLVATLQQAKKPVFIYGERLSPKTSAQAVKALLEVARLAHGTVSSIKGGANSLVAALYGLEGSFTLNGQQSVYAALGDEAPARA